MNTKTDDGYVTQAEFARRCNCSRQLVSNAVKTGRITLSDRVNERGNPLINFNTQYISFVENKVLSQVRTNSGRKPKNPPKPKPVKKKVAEKPKETKPKKVKLTPKIIKEEMRLAGKYMESIPPVDSLNYVKPGLDDNIKRMSVKQRMQSPVLGTIAYNSNRKTAADADRSELKFAQELEQVIPTDVAIAIAGAKMSSIKESLLAFPSRTVGIIEAVVKSAVKEFEEGQEPLLYNKLLNTLNDGVRDILASLSANQDTLSQDMEDSFANK